MKKKNINSHTILLLITIALFFVLYGAGYFMYGFGDNAKGFEKLQTFLDIFRTNAALICIACGMTCVMLTGGIDISVGSLVAMDCMILSVGMENNGISPTLLVPFVYCFRCGTGIPDRLSEYSAVYCHNGRHVLRPWNDGDDLHGSGQHNGTELVQGSCRHQGIYAF